MNFSEELEMDAENRKYPRENVMSTVEYGIEGEISQSYKCVTSNVSGSSAGFCIYSRGELNEGQIILIRKSDLPFPCRRADVRWARKINERLYVAGLKCLS